MSDGKTHLRNWWVGWVGEIPLSIIAINQTNPYIGIGSNVGYLLGYVFDPDMDQFGTTGAESRMVNKLPIIGYLFFSISSIYGAVFRHNHRSFITHFPVVSTIIRLFFLFFWMIIPYYLHWIRYEDWQGQVYLGILGGLSLADALHYIADILSSEFKHKKR
jgi:uncharacterized metal-binding protein